MLKVFRFTHPFLFIFFALCLCLCLTGSAQPLPANGAKAYTLKGRLFERGTKRPLGDVNVFVLPAKIKAVTDKSGRFTVEGLAAGDFTWVVNFTGYLRLEQSDTLREDGEEKERVLYLQRERYTGFETTIVGRSEKRDASTRTMEQSQFLTAPGSQGDPVKAVQNLPGVARVNGFSSQVVIQGGAPKDTSYLFEDQEVPLIFHFGGITSIVTPEAVESVDYLSAGYGAEYGRATGGLVGLRLRKPSNERIKGFAFADIAKAGGLVEGPINDHSSFLVTGRYSYIGVVLASALKGNDQLDLTVAPSFYDFTAVYDNRISDKDQFKLVAINSHDELAFLFKQPLKENPTIRGRFNNQTNFSRIIPKWTRKHSETLTSRWSFGLGQDMISIDVGDNYLLVKQMAFSQRVEAEKKINSYWTSSLGLDGFLSHTSVDFNLPVSYSGGGVSGPISSDSVATASYTRDDYDVGVYWRNRLHDESSPWTHILSLRSDHLTETHETFLEPRVTEQYQLSSSLRLKGAAGVYHQAPQPQEIAPSLGNPDLRAERAIHTKLGFDKDLRGGSDRGWEVGSDVFYKYLDKLVVQSASQSIPYTNDGKGRAYGIETTLKYQAKPWTAWLVYSLSQSLRSEPGQGEHPFRYDQTHNINLMAMVDLRNNWKLSTRFRYVTGDPSTPITGATFDSDQDVYIPLRGGYYSTRASDFMQFDLRADKTWVRDTYTWSFYADIQNVTNRTNVQSVRYAYNYASSATISDLPLLPILGVRGDF